MVKKSPTDKVKSGADTSVLPGNTLQPSSGVKKTLFRKGGDLILEKPVCTLPSPGWVETGERSQDGCRNRALKLGKGELEKSQTGIAWLTNTQPGHRGKIVGELKNQSTKQ